MSAKKRKREHAKQRAFQRYGIHLTRELNQKIIQLIRTGKSKLLQVQSRTREVHYIQSDQEYYVVYDNKNNNILTFLNGVGGKVFDKFEANLLFNNAFIFPV